MRGLAGANVVLNTFGNGGLSFLSWAKRNGAKIVTDVFITPVADEVEAAEHVRWPGWEQSHVSSKLIASNRVRVTKLVELSDLLLCPSASVIDGLKTIPTFHPAKVALLPYGLGDVAIERGDPYPRRVLFAGTANLRKGIPYLASAASMLRGEGYEIRVAGAASSALKSRKECAALTFLGKLSREQVADEFKRADVFCLPSLAEGMASVSLEALARGVPCVVTKAAGAPIIDQHDGLIVQERDPAGIAAAIRSICENRDLRRAMSDCALETAKRHEGGIIGDELLLLLKRLVQV
jgi:glycosyltransferase involved in cell wall biosynthesis